MNSSKISTNMWLHNGIFFKCVSRGFPEIETSSRTSAHRHLSNVATRTIHPSLHSMIQQATTTSLFMLVYNVHGTHDVSLKV